MQKPFLTLSCILVFGAAAFAQDTTWFNSSWKETTADKANYFRTKVKTASGWLVTDHYLTGQVQMIGRFSDDSLKIRVDTCRWYNNRGVVTHMVTYKNGEPNGLEVAYYDNGMESVRGDNKDGKHDGDWVGYYQSGKIAGKAKFKADEESSVALYNEDGTRNKKEHIFLRDSEFPGGGQQLLRFLNKNLRYPDSAVVYETQGTVSVGFWVSAEGKISEMKVVVPVDKYLDAEALRVLAMMPDWEPMIMGGVKRESYHIQPVEFKLQAE